MIFDKKISLSKAATIAVVAISGLFLSSCGSGEKPEGGATEEKTQEVNVYSHRHYEADEQLFKKFTEATGIKVNVIKASADQLIEKLELEGENTPADVLITVDGGRLNLAKEKGLLQPVQSDVLAKNTRAPFADPENYWFGLTYRARVLVYNKEKVKPEDLSTYEALTDKKWKDRILVRSSENLYNQSLMASIIAHDGPEAAKKWAAAVLANMARDPQGNDTDQMMAAASGDGDVAIVNSYYLGKLLNTDDAEQKKLADKLAIFFPNQDGRGTHVNVSGGGVTAHAKNKENAVKLMEFLISDEAQKIFAEGNYEYPVNPNAEVAATLAQWGDFKIDTLEMAALGKNNAEAVKIFDEVGWK